MTAQGSSWTISPTNSPGQCVDAGAGLNNTALVLAACNATSSSQSWNISANAANGSFTVAAASTGRCMNVRSASIAAGAVMEVYDCASGSTAQQFNIQATLTGATDSNAGTGGTGGATGTGATGGTGGTPVSTVSAAPGPCSSFCSSPVVMSTQSFQSGSLGTAAACHQTTFPITSYTMAYMTGRTFSINGKAVPGPGPLPPKVNGGYCFQASAGGFAVASFGTF